MDNQNTHWLEAITTDSHRQIAIKLNIAQSSISRAVHSPVPNPALVRDIARMYGADPLIALSQANFITHDELAAHRTVTPLAHVTNMELLQELLRRERGRV